MPEPEHDWREEAERVAASNWQYHRDLRSAIQAALQRAERRGLERALQGARDAQASIKKMAADCVGGPTLEQVARHNGAVDAEMAIACLIMADEGKTQGEGVGP